MAMYSYVGIDSSGKEVKSQVNSDNLASAKHKIRTKGVMLVSISEQKAASDSQKSESLLSFSFNKKVSIDELALMTRQFATLVKAKIQIVECLSALSDQVENPGLKVALSEIKQKVNEGKSLAQSLSDYPKIFNQVYINMVEAGEASGTLDIVLLRLAEFTESQRRLRSKVVQAVTYPGIIAAVGFIMMNIIFIFVIPKITKIFISMKRELPLQTKICIAISDFTINYWYVVIIGGFLSWRLFARYIKGKKGQSRWHRFLLKSPILSKLVTMIDVSRFCSTLATLLNSGVPILVSMRIVKNLITNVHIQDSVEKAKDNVSEGKSMTGPLIESKIFPTMVTHMITLGERSGELEPMLEIVSENYNDQIDVQLARITAILQPLMMLILGILVFFIVYSVIVPIMDLNSIRQ